MLWRDGRGKEHRVGGGRMDGGLGEKFIRKNRRGKKKRGRGGGLTLEPRLLFLSSSLHPPVSDAAVWRKSQRLP